MPPIICIVGKNKHNKAILIEALIKELKSRGLKVGALKHHKHGDFEIDHPGKDTWRYAKAGADTVAISSSVKLAVIKNVDMDMQIDDICDRYFADDDIVLADGFALSDKPRIIVADCEEDIGIFERGCSIVAVVGRAELEVNDTASIADKICSFSSRSNGF